MVDSHQIHDNNIDKTHILHSALSFQYTMVRVLSEAAGRTLYRGRAWCRPSWGWVYMRCVLFNSSYQYTGYLVTLCACFVGLFYGTTWFTTYTYSECLSVRPYLYVFKIKMHSSKTIVITLKIYHYVQILVMTL